MMSSAKLQVAAFATTVWVLSCCQPVATAAAPGDWPCWGGPHRDHVSRERGWTWEWPKSGPNLLWKANLGTGYSNVAIVGGRIYTMGSNELEFGGETLKKRHSGQDPERYEDTVHCLDAASGEPIWKFTYKQGGKPMGYAGTYSTPTVQDGRVFTMDKYGQVHALDADRGTLLWKKDLREVISAEHRAPNYGHSTSALVVGNLVYFNWGRAGVALNAADGTVAWKSEPLKARKNGANHSSPKLVTIDGREAVAFYTYAGVVGVEPASGKVLWTVPYNVTETAAGDPLFSGNSAWLNTRQSGGSRLFRIEDGKAIEVWQSRELMNECYTTGLWEGYLYGCHSKTMYHGVLKCLDFRTGEVKWSREMCAMNVTIAGGRLLIFTYKGELIVAEASPEEYRELARVVIRGIGGPCYTAPVLLNRRLYLRGGKPPWTKTPQSAPGVLYCLDVAAETYGGIQQEKQKTSPDDSGQ